MEGLTLTVAMTGWDMASEGEEAEGERGRTKNNLISLYINDVSVLRKTGPCNAHAAVF